MSVLINAYCTLRDPPPLNFPHKLNDRQDLNGAELPEHLDGFVGYLMNLLEGKMTQNLYHVMRHVQRVQHHVSMDVPAKNLGEFTEWASSANAIVFLPDGTVRDPALNVLVSPGVGEPDGKAELPYPQDARERKARTEKELDALGIHVPPYLPPVISELEVNLRSAADVAQRSLALFLVAVRAESLASNDEIPVAQLHEKMPFAFSVLTPCEEQFLNLKPPREQEVIQFAWRYEALFLLQWALGLADALPFPSTICDVPAVANTALERIKPEMIDRMRLIPVTQILDALDLHFRLHWAVVQARVEDRKPPGNLDGGVVMERHYALNWLVRFENKDWDDVTTPT
jgi:hypothetical protein